MSELAKFAMLRNPVQLLFVTKLADNCFKSRYLKVFFISGISVNSE
jgi:hypothetical protein